MDLRTGLEQRLVALRAEAAAGRHRLAELQAEQHRLLAALARIDTAVGILADELTGSAPDDPPPAGASTAAAIARADR